MYVYMMTTTLQFFVWSNFMSIWYCAKFVDQYLVNCNLQKYRKLFMMLAPVFNNLILQQLCRCLDYAFAVCPHRFISTVVVTEEQGNTTRHCITLLPVARPRWINSAHWWWTVMYYIMAPSCVWKYCLNWNMLTTITYVTSYFLLQACASYFSQTYILAISLYHLAKFVFKKHA